MSKTPCPLPTASNLSDLRDQLSLFAAHETREAREYYLQRLAELFGAESAAWVISVLKDSCAEDDPSLAWFPHLLTKLHADGVFSETLRTQHKPIQDVEFDAITSDRLAGPHAFRVLSLPDLAPEGTQGSTRYREFLLEIGVSDSMWGIVPVRNDIEIYVGLHRGAEKPDFSQQEAETYAHALKGLKWFFRHQALGEGVFAADVQLTNSELRVLRCLLQGHSKHNIAYNLSKSPHTINDAIKSIYKKCGVSSRAALTALWLGKNH
ncbi:MAG: helix-turn-helix transcriptional regulator [Rhodobacteraceae bacterium]|nr:helix-turn-helix transcriptional regulator [Paracoccaceae bacterium]MBR9824008.1 helix-turn-helix transcriptional regulator [Paracoccaceae bacterium]